MKYNYNFIIYIGLPIRTTFTNIFFGYFEETLLKSCPYEFKPVIYKRYVDGTFLLFESKDHIEKFRCYLNFQHHNIKFTSETEEKNAISFLDIKIRRINNSFSTSTYLKVITSEVFTNFEIFIPVSYKSNLIFYYLEPLNYVQNLIFSSRDT